MQTHTHTHTYTSARAHTLARRFAEVSRLTDETERLVDENAKLRGVIDELRVGHSELQSDTERREVEAQRIVHSTQKVRCLRKVLAATMALASPQRWLASPRR